MIEYAENRHYCKVRTPFLPEPLVKRTYDITIPSGKALIVTSAELQLGTLSPRTILQYLFSNKSLLYHPAATWGDSESALPVRCTLSDFEPESKLQLRTKGFGRDFLIWLRSCPDCKVRLLSEPHRCTACGGWFFIPCDAKGAILYFSEEHLHFWTLLGHPRKER